MTPESPAAAEATRSAPIAESAAPEEPQLARPAFWLLPVGAVIGFVGALAGVGGGLFAMPVLYLGWKLPLKHAVATALALVGVNALVATITESLRDDPDIRWSLVAATVVGTLTGAQFGYRAAKTISSTKLKVMFVIVFPTVALYMIWKTVASTGETDVAREFSALEHVFATLAGLGGGFLAPLLGVGGGILIVPGLFLMVGGLGFAGARACSLAATVVTASRSAFLHYRDGRVNTTAAGYLSLGALAGGSLGVRAFHMEGVAIWGKIVFAATLIFLTLRFLAELRSERAQAIA